METWTPNKTPTKVDGRKTTVSGEHLIAIIPRVRVVDLVRIDVPTVIVPVHVDRAKHRLFSYKKPSVPLPIESQQVV